MVRMIKWLALVIFLSTFCGAKAQAQTINAASCSSSAVQAALNSVAADGTMVVIPAGTCTWTTTVTYNQVYSTTIQGQSIVNGTCAPGGACTATDNTVITDAISRPTNCGSGDVPTLRISTAASKSFRMTGITLNHTGNTSCVGVISVAGSSHQLRIDHGHFIGAATIFSFHGYVWGVVDHNLFSWSNAIPDLIRIQHDGWNGEGFPNAGDKSWNDATTFGSNRAIFVENNNFIVSGAGPGNYADDCYQGGRFVWRYNVMVNAELQTHPTGGAGRFRGCRSEEIYKNTFTGTGGIGADFIGFFFSSGSALIWGNTQDNGYSHFVQLNSMRRCGTSAGCTYNQGATPGGWGYCGTSFNGTVSNWDQNTNASTGYRCLDQPGTGKSDLLTGGFTSDGSGSNNVANATTGCTSAQACAWPHQALEPVYEWLNTSSAQYYWISINSPGAFNGNEDYYNYSTTFNGTGGVGSGILTNRPSTCTPNPDPLGVGGVAYWATDQGSWNQSGNGGQGQLSVCTATNTWTVYYTPYAYPHPLTVGSGTPPGPPTGLAAIVN